MVFIMSRKDRPCMRVQKKGEEYMGFKLDRGEMDKIFSDLAGKYDIYAPVVKEGEGTFSDIDVIRYDKVKSLDEIEWKKRSDYSFKEVLLSINETIFYFTEDQTTVPGGPEKEILLFLRSCDLHAVKRLDQIYLHNTFEDFYYRRVRDKVHFVLMGCTDTCDSGFCVSMGTNISSDYDMYIRPDGDQVQADVRDPALAASFAGCAEADVTPDFVTENKAKVTLPRNITQETAKSDLWTEYGERCITCGR